MADTTSPVAAAVSAVESKQTQSNEAAATVPGVPEKSQEIWAKKERALRQQQKALQAERAAWEQERGRYNTEYVPKSKLMEDPLTALAEAGFTTEKLSELLLNAPSSNDPTVRALKAELSAIKQRMQDADKRAEEQQTAQYKQALKQISNEIKMTVDADADFATIKEAGMQDAVTELIEQTFNETGVLMDVRDACKEVETHLVEEAFKMSQLAKVQARLKPAEPEVTVPPSQQQSQMKTLTNAVSQASPRKSAEKDRIERAKAAFYGNRS